jgi:hypothetical protein
MRRSRKAGDAGEHAGAATATSSVLNFAAWNFAAAILNSGAILRPQLHVASRNSVEANNSYADGDGSSDHEADDVVASNNDNE